MKRLQARCRVVGELARLPYNAARSSTERRRRNLWPVAAWARLMLERFWTFAQERTAKLRCLVAKHWRAAPVSPRAEPPLLTIEEGWVRATGAVTAAISGFGRIQALHAAAASQIEAADYTLQQLLEELSRAIPRPADGSALRSLLATVEEREAFADEVRAA